MPRKLNKGAMKKFVTKKEQQVASRKGQGKFTKPKRKGPQKKTKSAYAGKTPKYGVKRQGKAQVRPGGAMLKAGKVMGKLENAERIDLPGMAPVKFTSKLDTFAEFTFGLGKFQKPEDWFKGAGATVGQLQLNVAGLDHSLANGQVAEGTLQTHPKCSELEVKNDMAATLNVPLIAHYKQLATEMVANQELYQGTAAYIGEIYQPMKPDYKVSNLFPNVCCSGISNVLDDVQVEDGDMFSFQEYTRQGAPFYDSAATNSAVNGITGLFGKTEEWLKEQMKLFRSQSNNWFKGVRESGLGFAPSKWQFFMPFSLPDGYFNKDYFDKVNKSMRYKLTEVMASFAGQGTYGKRGAGQLAYFVIPSGMKMDIPILTNGLIPGSTFKKVKIDITETLNNGVTVKTGKYGANPYGHKNIKGAQCLSYVGERSYDLSMKASGGYTGSRIRLLHDYDYAFREQEKFREFVIKKGGKLLDLEAHKVQTLTVSKLLGRLFKTPWLQQSGEDAKIDQYNWETLTNGTLCFAWMPNLHTYIEDKMPRCDFIDQRGNCLVIRTQCQGTYLEEDDLAFQEVLNSQGFVDVQNFVPRAIQNGTQFQQGDGDGNQVNNLVQQFGVPKYVAEMLGATVIDPMYTNGQYGNAVSVSGYGYQPPFNYQAVLPAFPPPTGGDKEVGEGTYSQLMREIVDDPTTIRDTTTKQPTGFCIQYPEPLPNPNQLAIDVHDNDQYNRVALIATLDAMYGGNFYSIPVDEHLKYMINNPIAAHVTFMLSGEQPAALWNATLGQIVSGNLMKSLVLATQGQISDDNNDSKMTGHASLIDDIADVYMDTAAVSDLLFTVLLYQHFRTIQARIEANLCQYFSISDRDLRYILKTSGCPLNTWMQGAHDAILGARIASPGESIYTVFDSAQMYADFFQHWINVYDTLVDHFYIKLGLTSWNTKEKRINRLKHVLIHKGRMDPSWAMHKHYIKNCSIAGIDWKKIGNAIWKVACTVVKAAKFVIEALPFLAVVGSVTPQGIVSNEVVDNVSQYMFEDQAGGDGQDHLTKVVPSWMIHCLYSQVTETNGISPWTGQSCELCLDVALKLDNQLCPGANVAPAIVGVPVDGIIPLKMDDFRWVEIQRIQVAHLLTGQGESIRVSEPVYISTHPVDEKHKPKMVFRFRQHNQIGILDPAALSVRHLFQPSLDIEQGFVQTTRYSVGEDRIFGKE